VTREELQAVIEVVLGLHNTPGRVTTILAAADAYAAEVAARAEHGEIVRVRTS
jgi:hypothetical protein